VECIGILYNTTTSDSRLSRRAAIGDSLAQTTPNFPVGRPLVEVFWVRLFKIDKEVPGELYGTIEAIDGLGTQHLFNRGSSDYQSVYPGQDVELKGPDRPISAADNFLIDLSLKDYDPEPWDDEIIKDQFSWNAYDPFNEFDKVLFVPIKGKYGVGEIKYIVLSDASEALIEVLISGDGNKVSGSITASNGFGEIQLFKKSHDDKQRVEVKSGGAITLLRKSMAVPLNKELFIHADLKDHDHEIAKGSEVFEPQINHATPTKYIKGKHGKIEVKIHWF
jgi:hypothetical protein